MTRMEDLEDLECPHQISVGDCDICVIGAHCLSYPRGLERLYLKYKDAMFKDLHFGVSPFGLSRSRGLCGMCGVEMKAQKHTV